MVAAHETRVHEPRGEPRAEPRGEQPRAEPRGEQPRAEPRGWREGGWVVPAVGAEAAPCSAPARGRLAAGSK